MYSYKEDIMKKYIRCANKFTNKATQIASLVFTPKQIIKNSLKEHKGEPMLQVFMNIVNDPHIQFGEADKSGNCVIYYDDKNIGWINPKRFMGWIDDKAYEKIEKFDMSQLDSIEDEEFDDDYSEDEEWDDDWDY